MSNISNIPLVDLRAQYRDRLVNRASVVKSLNEVGVHYPFAIHELNAYKSLEYRQGTFPVSESWARQCLSLPIYAEMRREVIPRTADILNHSVYH